jgi:hypothetical protein
MPIIDQLSTPTPQNLSLQGAPGLSFENEGQRTTSPIQALTSNGGALLLSQDLISGRISRQIPLNPYTAGPSNSPISNPNGLEGLPYYPSLGGVKANGQNTYKDLGPREGKY